MCDILWRKTSELLQCNKHILLRYKYNTMDRGVKMNGWFTIPLGESRKMLQRLVIDVENARERSVAYFVTGENKKYDIAILKINNIIEEIDKLVTLK